MGEIVLGRYLDSSTDSVSSKRLNALVTEPYDTVQLATYNAAGDPLTVLYRQGGVAGTIIATLTLTYNGDGTLASVVRT